MQQEKGAAAVEMALLLPVLLLLLLGIMEFGRAFNAQVTVTSAAREGVRVMAITNDKGQAETAARSAAGALNPSSTDFTISYETTPSSTSATCAADRQMTMTVSYTLQSLTGLAGPFTMTGKGVMLCGG